MPIFHRNENHFDFMKFNLSYLFRNFYGHVFFEKRILYAACQQIFIYSLRFLKLHVPLLLFFFPLRQVQTVSISYLRCLIEHVRCYLLDRDIELIYYTIRKSSDVLTRDPMQLGAQVSKETEKVGKKSSISNSLLYLYSCNCNIYLFSFAFLFFSLPFPPFCHS